MMYAVKNLTTGNLAKDAITGKVNYYLDRRATEKVAECMNAFARIDEKNRHYVVVEIMGQPWWMTSDAEAL